MIITMTKPSEHFPPTIDEYLATVPNDVHKVLQKLRHTIKSLFTTRKKGLPTESYI